MIQLLQRVGHGEAVAAAVEDQQVLIGCMKRRIGVGNRGLQQRKITRKHDVQRGGVGQRECTAERNRTVR